MLDRLKEALLGSKQMTGREETQPTMAETSYQEYVLRHNTKYFVLNHTTNNLMGTSPVGFSVPNPITINGVPSSPRVLGTVQTQISDAVKGKGC